eukprot:1999299-Amphidinium_carterae.1
MGISCMHYDAKRMRCRRLHCAVEELNGDVSIQLSPAQIADMICALCHVKAWTPRELSHQPFKSKG